jgi:FAD/FMN-containing dehydrogenase
LPLEDLVTTHPTSPPRAGATVPAESLRGLCGGAVHVTGDPGYDVARVPWNAAVDQRPAAVAYPGSTAEVAEVIRSARRAGLRVAPQGTGHNARPLGALDDVVLLRTAALCGVTVDPASRTARVGAGVLWQDAVEAAAEHDLAALHGSSPGVGVVGYSLGGGIGWYARQLGLQANHVTAVELVTADGEQVRADSDHEPELFWALRGGGGNFGVVTALEFALHDVGSPVAGMMVWDVTRAAEVLHRWSRWAGCTPDEATTALRIVSVPRLPEVPEALRGRTIVVIDGAVLGDHDDATAVLSPLSELQPEINTFAPAAPVSLTRLHMDPERPTPFVSGSRLLGALPDDAIEAVLGVAGPGSGSSLLVAAELRQLGGALARPHPGGGALPSIDGEFLFFCGARALDTDAVSRGLAEVDRTIAAVTPWAAGGHLLNLTAEPVDPSSSYSPDSWARLCALRRAVDPDGLFVANHAVPSGPPVSGELPHQR